MKRILLARPRGYCAGVERAVESVERALAQFGSPVYVRRQIVHNRHVVAELEAPDLRYVAVGDLGASFRTATPVTQLILSRLPVTLELTLLSMLIGSAIGISTGIAAAVWRNTPIDDGARIVSLFGLSISVSLTTTGTWGPELRRACNRAA